MYCHLNKIKLQHLQQTPVYTCNCLRRSATFHTVSLFSVIYTHDTRIAYLSYGMSK